MSGTWRFGDGNPFAGAPCASEEAKNWMRAHRGSSKWDYEVNGESETAHVQRLMSAQRECKPCTAREACLRIRSELVKEFALPVPGVWGGRIFGEPKKHRVDLTQTELMPREDMAA